MHSVYLHNCSNLMIDLIFVQIAASVISDVYFSLSLLPVTVYPILLFDEKDRKAEITSGLS